MTPEEIRTLTLFNTVESRPEINQRQLALELDVSLGLTNTYFQRVLKKEGMDNKYLTEEFCQKDFKKAKSWGQEQFNKKFIQIF